MGHKRKTARVCAHGSSVWTVWINVMTFVLLAMTCSTTLNCISGYICVFIGQVQMTFSTFKFLGKKMIRHQIQLITFVFLFQSLIMHDQCPVQYVTYNQTNASNAGSDENEDDGYFQWCHYLVMTSSNAKLAALKLEMCATYCSQTVVMTVIW